MWQLSGVLGMVSFCRCYFVQNNDNCQDVDGFVNYVSLIYCTAGRSLFPLTVRTSFILHQIQRPSFSFCHKLYFDVGNKQTNKHEMTLHILAHFSSQFIDTNYCQNWKITVQGDLVHLVACGALHKPCCGCRRLLLPSNWNHIKDPQVFLLPNFSARNLLSNFLSETKTISAQLDRLNCRKQSYEAEYQLE